MTYSIEITIIISADRIAYCVYSDYEFDRYCYAIILKADFSIEPTLYVFTFKSEF